MIQITTLKSLDNMDGSRALGGAATVAINMIFRQSNSYAPAAEADVARGRRPGPTGGATL